MYRIIGADQKEYGPITAEQLRAWLSEGRINAQTRVCAEGTSDWKPLGSFPEFADAFPGTAAPVSAALTFAASAAPINGGRAAALQAVKGPAIALIIVAAIGVLYYAFNGVFSLVAGGALFSRQLPPNMSPQMRAFIEGMRGPMAGVINLVIALLDAFVIFGAVKFMRLQSFGLAMTACIISLLPCQCCCLLGLPFGIWGLIVLNKPEVKSHFE
jgi:hypothetical protein